MEKPLPTSNPFPGPIPFQEVTILAALHFFSIFTVQYVYLCLFLGLAFYLYKLFMPFCTGVFHLTTPGRFFFSRVSKADFHPGCISPAPGPASSSTGQASVCSHWSVPMLKQGLHIWNITFCVHICRSVLFVWTAVLCFRMESQHFMKLCSLCSHFGFSVFQTMLPLHPVPALLWMFCSCPMAEPPWEPGVPRTEAPHGHAWGHPGRCLTP